MKGFAGYSDNHTQADQMDFEYQYFFLLPVTEVLIREVVLENQDQCVIGYVLMHQGLFWDILMNDPAARPQGISGKACH